MHFTQQNTNGVVYMTASNISAKHCFTTRYGGVSTGCLASLNLGENRGDAPENVIENYRRLGEATGIRTDHMAFTRQVHGNDVRIVTEADVHTLMTGVPYDADGVVTNIPGLAIIAFVADCVPLLLHDPVNKVAAAVHCGWRSTVADIMGVAVEKMVSLGAEPKEIRGAVGASIGYCCFEVGPEVPEAVFALLPDDHEGLVRAGEKEGKFYVDLREAIARRLVQLGLKRENILVSQECTVCSHDKYWSHRYTNGNRGSQAALIMLEA